MMQRYLHKTLCLLIQTPSSFLTNYLIITVSSNYSQILLRGDCRRYSLVRVKQVVGTLTDLVMDSNVEW